VSFNISVCDNWFVDERIPGVKWMLVSGTTREILLNPSLCYQFIGSYDKNEAPRIQFSVSYLYEISKVDPKVPDTRAKELEDLLTRKVVEQEGYLVDGKTPLYRGQWKHVKCITAKASINVFRFDYLPEVREPLFYQIWMALQMCLGIRKTRPRVTLIDNV
jgi:hypothetical protein